jgi:hypothetical protein
VAEEKGNLTEAWAYRLADSIRSYWRAQGYSVNTWAEKVTPTPGNSFKTSGLYQVRSDMVSGQPRSA